MYIDVEKIVMEYTDRLIELSNERPESDIWFVTSVFQDNPNKEQAGLINSEWYIQNLWRQYEVFYDRLCSKIVRNKRRSDRYQYLPLTFDFLDYGGTRKNSKKGLQDPYTPHFHSLYLIHPETAEHFQKLVEANFEPLVREEKLARLISVDAKPVKRTRESFQKTVSYSSKLMECHTGKCIHTSNAMVNQFPKSPSQQPSRMNPRHAAIERMKQLQQQGTSGPKSHRF